jgi:hypothetical protein
MLDQFLRFKKQGKDGIKIVCKFAGQVFFAAGQGLPG